jgi:hypothetical protein
MQQSCRGRGMPVPDRAACLHLYQSMRQRQGGMQQRPMQMMGGGGAGPMRGVRSAAPAQRAPPGGRGGRGGRGGF